MAQAYLNWELNKMTPGNHILWQPLGIENAYYRINLSLVLDGTIPQEELLTAFVESANKATPPDLNDWKANWMQILSEISLMESKPANFINDSLMLDKILRQGNYVVHHSESYMKLYQPHYRIVSSIHFHKLRDKYLENLDWEW